jgi:hypothetical protein
VGEERDPRPSGASRRELLRVGGAAAAGAVVGGAAGGVIGHAIGAHDARPVPDPETAPGFAVHDHWAAAVPSQTFCNRSFFEEATPIFNGDAYEVLTRHGEGLFGSGAATPSAPPTPIP